MRKISKSLLVGVSLLSLSTPAWAADAAAKDGEQASTDSTEIIVSARRKDELVQDVPLVVNTVTAEDLQKNGIRDFKELTSTVPGLALVPNANGIGSQSSMRGVNYDVNLVQPPTVAFYFNDAPANQDFIYQGLYDVGQIEVLRGPQGTLRGEASPSGSITITTKRPDLGSAGGYVEATAGSPMLLNTQFAINVPVVGDMLAVRVAGLRNVDRSNDVFSVNAPGIPPRRETDSIRASVRFEPASFAKFDFTYEGLKTDMVRWNQVESFSLANPGFTPTAGVPSYGTITLAQRKSVEFAPSTVAQRFAYFNWHAQFNFSGQQLTYVGSFFKGTYNPSTNNDVAGEFPSLVNFQTTLTKTQQDTHELRLQNTDRLFGMLDYVVGVYRNGQWSSTDLTTGAQIGLFGGRNTAGGLVADFPLGAPSISNASITIPKSANYEEAVFGNLTLHFGEQTEISGGLRYIHFKTPGQSLFVNGTLSSPALPINDKPTIYNFTLKHRFSDSFLVYASTGSSWRYGAHAIGDFSARLSPLEIAHTSLPSETSKSYEIGFKSDFFDKKLRFNATYYHQSFKNYALRSATGVYYINQTQVTAGGSTFLVPGISQFNFASAVPVKVDGVEAELSWRPIRNFSISTLINYSTSKIGNGKVACTDVYNNATGAVGKDGLPDTIAPRSVADMIAAYGTEHLAECAAGGQSATFQPKWSGTLTAEYSQALGAGVEGFLRGLVSYRGKSDNDPNNPYDNVGAYALVNLYAGLRDPGGAWSLTVYAKNVGNVKELTTLSSNPAFINQTNVILPYRFTGGNPPVQITGGPLGTTSTAYNSGYTNVTMTAPREFGATLRIAFGSR